MTIALVDKTLFQANGGTSSAINSTGATLLIAVVGFALNYGNSGITSDSKGNTWTALTDKSDAFSGSRIYYVNNPIVGSAHTLTGAGAYQSIQFYAFSGTDTTSVFDVQNGAIATAQPINTGSVTPSQNNSLIISGYGCGDSNNGVSVDSGFSTPYGAYVNSIGSGFGGFSAYIIQTTLGAVNPQWNDLTNDGDHRSATIAVFKPSGGGGGGTQNITMTTAALMFAGLALGANAKTQTSITKASLTFAGHVLGVSAGQVLSVAKAGLTFTGHALAVNAKTMTAVTKAALTWTGAALSANAKTMTAVVQATLLWTGRALGANAKTTLTVAQASLSWAGRAITVTGTLSIAMAQATIVFGGRVLNFIGTAGTRLMQLLGVGQ